MKTLDIGDIDNLKRNRHIKKKAQWMMGRQEGESGGGGEGQAKEESGGLVLPSLPDPPPPDPDPDDDPPKTFKDVCTFTFSHCRPVQLSGGFLRGRERRNRR